MKMSSQPMPIAEFLRLLVAIEQWTLRQDPNEPWHAKPDPKDGQQPKRFKATLAAIFTAEFCLSHKVDLEKLRDQFASQVYPISAFFAEYLFVRLNDTEIQREDLFFDYDREARSVRPYRQWWTEPSAVG